MQFWLHVMLGLLNAMVLYKPDNKLHIKSQAVTTFVLPYMVALQNNKV